MKKALLLWMVFMSISVITIAQKIEVYPTNWWVGMKMNSIQLLVRSTTDEFSSDKVTINYPGINVLKTHQFTNKNYIAVDITIAPETVPGEVIIQCMQKGKPRT